MQLNRKARRRIAWLQAHFFIYAKGKPHRKPREWTCFQMSSATSHPRKAQRWFRRGGGVG